MMMTSLRRLSVWKMTAGHCAYCGLALCPDNVESISGGAQSWMEIDHITSPKDGGGEEMSNLLPSCSSCNASKGRKCLEAYRHQQARKLSGRPHIPRDVLDWLVSVGITLPDLPHHKFWFELHGVSCLPEAAE
ncbi:HNH endonuclease [Pseudohoeflea coraliihabitans]|uniref:HNH endonuclease n=1 Tax=Pseudohoeflea coraliihabitans TaxID=2860393 RepID=A0ABS6WLN0_9HYPH|nr:HNH endonuclease [Pseudohoeflea sp. DP4N28-3]MBW3096841.1 HNH endonuclease [Pseudohoeflea sp. DP4N28-3]